MKNSFWAKASLSKTGEFRWAPLQVHLHDALEVGHLLMKNWVPHSQKELLAQDIGISVLELEALAKFMCGAHDVGKATPAFQTKPLREQSGFRLGAFTQLQNLGLGGMEAGFSEQRAVPHNLASQIIITEWLRDRFDLTAQAQTLAIVAGTHHGIAPIQYELVEISERYSRWYGDPETAEDTRWQEAQFALLDEIADAAGASPVLAKHPILTQPAQLFLIGIVIGADWIASDETRFRLIADGAPVRFDSSKQRASTGFASTKLPHPWQPEPANMSIEELFSARFDLRGARPNESQRQLLRAIEAENEPQLYILETLTGAGKTEAALIAAEALAGKFRLAGITMALPTQATTNAMAGRVLKWMRNVPSENLDFQLIHGGRDQNDEFASLPFSEHISSVFDDPDSAPVTKNLWADRSRLRLLANFTVCTIDQVLLAGLRLRYNMLRHLGLSRKVLIIDEVHAADVYMRQYLLRMLEWLGAYGVPVICLSATLPTSIRQELLTAYSNGKNYGKQREVRRGRRRAKSQPDESIIEEQPQAKNSVPGYPLLSWTSGKQGFTSREFEWDGEVRGLEYEFLLDDDVQAVVDLVVSKVRCGGRVLIVRNTVRRAVETYEALRELFPDTKINHSRFVADHRIAKDKDLLEWFGRGISDEGETKIVVATQVAEQSLDIDADLLITDLAPVDLLLQRAGRLHRHHERERPEEFRKPKFYIAGAEFDEEGIPVFPGDTRRRIYDISLLFKTAYWLHKRAHSERVLTVPNDVPTLIHAVYDASDTDSERANLRLSEHVAKFESEQEKKKTRAEASLVPSPRKDEPVWGFTSVTTSDAGSDAAIASQVRDAQESIEVLLIRKHEGRLFTLFDDDFELNPDAEPTPDQIADLVGARIRLPGYVVAGKAFDCFPGQLEDFYPAGWQSVPALKGEIFLLLEAESASAQLGKFVVTYSAERGLEVTW